MKCHSEERSDEESQGGVVITTTPRPFAESILNEVEGFRVTC
jgi:hypothetical protein